jgi:sugar lactone lactonase YvrE
MRNLLLVILLISCLSGQAQKLELKWRTDTVFRVPESIYFDKNANLLYVSNIDGKSNEKDGKGFISKVSADGKIIMLQWATGLNAPKGMGLHDNKLYVADLTRVVVIDIATGKIITSIEIDGAEFLNDIAVSKTGDVFVSDSATGKIFKINNNKSEIYFESKDFKRVNGLLVLTDGLYVADAGNGVNYKLNNDKQLTKYAETAQGADGIVLVGTDEYIVSSWGGEVYYVSAGKSQKLLDTKDQKLNSADIDYDEKTKTVFVPTFYGNSIMAYEFKK